MYLAITIHNMGVGQITQHDTLEEALEEIQLRAETQLERDLTEDEISDLENNEEFNIEQDADNEYTWSVNSLD